MYSISKAFSPRESFSWGCIPSIARSRGSIHRVPGSGVLSMRVSGVWVESRTRSSPRSGYLLSTAFTSTSCIRSFCITMLGKLRVDAVSRPFSAANAANPGGMGLFPVNTRSAARISLAWSAIARSIRSVKKPTAVTAATATIRATARSRSSPLRQSRLKSRSAKRQ